MRTLKLSLFASAMLLGSFSVTAQTAGEVMSKHITAVGGEDAWKKVTSIKKSGTVSIQGNEAKISFTQVQKKAFRMDLDLDLGTGSIINNYVILTTTEGWQYFPIGGQTEPQAMPADAVKESADQLDVTDEIIVLKQKGTKVDYVGKEKMDGKDVHKLKYDEEGSPVNLYFDATTGYLVKKTQMAEMQPGQKAEVASTYDDYKKVDGIALAMKGSDPTVGDITLTSVEVNKPVDESIFKAKK